MYFDFSYQKEFTIFAIYKVSVYITFQTVEDFRRANNQASYFLDQSRIKAQTNNSIRLIGEPMSIFVFRYVIKYMEFDMQHAFQQMEF